MVLNDNDAATYYIETDFKQAYISIKRDTEKT